MIPSSPAPLVLEASIQKKIARLTYLSKKEDVMPEEIAELEAEIEREYWVLNSAIAQASWVK